MLEDVLPILKFNFKWCLDLVVGNCRTVGLVSAAKERDTDERLTSSTAFSCSSMLLLLLLVMSPNGVRAIELVETAFVRLFILEELHTNNGYK